MKRNFTWSIRAIHLRSSTAFLSILKFWLVKKLKILPWQKRAFANYRDHAKIIVVFKRWCNTLRGKAGKQQLEIIFQVEIIEIRVWKKGLLKEEILPHYQNSRFFGTYANANKMSGLCMFELMDVYYIYLMLILLPSRCFPFKSFLCSSKLWSTKLRNIYV